MKKFFINIITFFVNLWWTIWSSIRWRKGTIHNIGIKPEDKVTNMYDIQKLLRKLYAKFKWTADGPDQLWDCITPPPQTYEHYLEGLLQDDCDGFHSLVYHCLINSGYECYLLSAASLKDGHCVLLFRFKDRWHVIDYTSIENGYNTAEEAIQSYNEIYIKRYNAEPVLMNSIVTYNYKNGTFHWKRLKDIK